MELRFYLNHPRAVSMVAEDDATGEIAGFVIAETQLQKGSPVGHIVTIDVRSSSRRRGIGRLLMEGVLSHLGEAGTAVVRLEVAADNDAAQAFYREFGFTQTGRIRGYYMGRLDALVMEKRLSG